MVPKATLTFSKCLEMHLQGYITIIAKIAEVAGKEYSIEQVCISVTHRFGIDSLLLVSGLFNYTCHRILTIASMASGTRQNGKRLESCIFRDYTI